MCKASLEWTNTCRTSHVSVTSPSKRAHEKSYLILCPFIMRETNLLYNKTFCYDMETCNLNLLKHTTLEDNNNNFVYECKLCVVFDCSLFCLSPPLFDENHIVFNVHNNKNNNHNERHPKNISFLSEGKAAWVFNEVQSDNQENAEAQNGKAKLFGSLKLFLSLAVFSVINLTSLPSDPRNTFNP